MKQIKPSYYDCFSCLASRCPDTCCQQWDIQVDPETAAFYHSLPGKLGEKIRSALRSEEGETLISLQDGHCPMEQEDGLCGIQSALGHQALCQVCRDFPRLRHDYGSFLELGLELSCPEAARILLTQPWAPPTVTEIPGGSEPDYDEDAMEVLLSTRDAALSQLQSPDDSPAQALTLLFFYGVHAQQLLDGEAPDTFDPAAALETARILAKPGDLTAVSQFFSRLEVLTPEWSALLQRLSYGPLPAMTLPLARYFVSRYWLQAVSDFDLYCRVKFILISVLLISALPGDFIWNAHLYSKEIENDIDNVDAILDAAYSNPLFTDDKILGFLQGMQEIPRD